MCTTTMQHASDHKKRIKKFRKKAKGPFFLRFEFFEMSKRFEVGPGGWSIIMMTRRLEEIIQN